VGGDLYRCGANGVLIRCITREEGCDLLAEIHGVSVGTMYLPTRWLVKPFDTYFTGL
jgi:hypothetical protein